jgi:hypothetical protein
MSEAKIPKKECFRIPGSEQRCFASCDRSRNSPWSAAACSALYRRFFFRFARLSKESHTRSLAVEALGATSRAGKAKTTRIQATKDPSVEVRYSAICALGLSGDKDVRKALRSRLVDTEEIPGSAAVSEVALQKLVCLPREARKSNKESRRQTASEPYHES